MSLGIEKVYNITKKVRRELIFNEKVVDYLYKKLIDDNYVLMVSASKYQPITKDILKQLLAKAEKDSDILHKEIFAELSDYPEYDGIPFEVTHASPYDHRWPGDYDEDAYDDWKIITTSLSDLFYDDTWDNTPIYVKKPEMFDFKEEQVITEKEKLEDTNCWW